MFRSLLILSFTTIVLLTSCAPVDTIDNPAVQITRTQIKESSSKVLEINIIIITSTDLNGIYAKSEMFVEFLNWNYNGYTVIKLLETLPVELVDKIPNNETDLLKIASWFSGGGEEIQVKFENHHLNIYKINRDEMTAESYEEGTESETEPVKQEFVLVQSLDLSAIDKVKIRNIFKY